MSAMTDCCTQGITGPSEASETMTLAAFSKALSPARGRSLTFAYAGHTTKAGYHITELKCARITGLDCGANVESWNETIFQLWDIAESVTGETMTVDKLIGIIEKYAKMLGAEQDSKISFEVSDGGEAMCVYAFDRIDLAESVATIHLAGRVSACKPLVRGIIAPAAAKGTCGGPKTAFADEAKKPACCG